MIQAARLRFKVATDTAELEQIRRLNYRTFVEEIPQHSPNRDHLLIDRFENENTFVVALRGARVVGMVCVRATRPFSLDAKLPDLDTHLPAHRSVCEIRLLAVEPEHRTGVVFRGLAACLGRHCLGQGHDLAVISGTERQLRLYRRMGFVSFGPMVGADDARFQPMYLTLETFHENGRAFVRRVPDAPIARFLPGPVEMEPDVRDAMCEDPVSHRSAAFVAEVGATRRALCTMTNARHVQALLGSGTLGNDAVAAQLSLLASPGLVLSNGEFGNRLGDHATRWGLRFTMIQQEWGTALTSDVVESALASDSHIRWVWAVHCETSTGVVNDLAMLRDVCHSRGALLCMDCISSLGAVPVDLDGVHLATGVSGKALGAPPGVSLVFHDHAIHRSSMLPRYVDLGLYEENAGVPFTQSSNLMHALHVAATRARNRALPSAAVVEDAAMLRARLRHHGFRLVGDDAITSPAVTTIALPRTVDSITVSDRLEAEGFEISAHSDYLRARNWVQVCLMGAYQRDRIIPLADAIASVLERRAAAS